MEFIILTPQDKEDFEVRSGLVKMLLSEHGQNLMKALINACLFCLPTFMSADISEVMWELKLADAQVRHNVLSPCD